MGTETREGLTAVLLITLVIVVAAVIGQRLPQHLARGTDARVNEPKPRRAEPSAAATTPILGRLQPSWAVAAIVALIAGVAGAVTMRLAGDGSRKLEERIQSLEDQVGDLRDTVGRMRRGY